MTKPEPRETEGRETQLSREEIVQAALRIARRVGVSKLTMRALATELGVTVAAAYYYVKSKNDLLQLVADEVVGSITTDPAPGADWESELRAWAVETARALDSYPGLYEVLASRPFTESALRSIDRLLANLVAGGFDDRSAALAYGLYYAYSMGYFMLRAHGLAEHVAWSSTPDHSKYPAFASVSVAAKSVTGREFLEFGIETIVAGLRARLHDAPPIART